MVTIKSLISFHHKPRSISDEGSLDYWPSDMISAFTCVSYCSIAFLYHYNLFAIEAELKQASRKKIQSIVMGSTVTAFAIYMFIAIFGYVEVCYYCYQSIMTEKCPDICPRKMVCSDICQNKIKFVLAFTKNDLTFML